MPLYRNDFLAGDVRLCLWRITEEVDEFVPPAALDLSHITSIPRRREILSVYALLSMMTGRNDLVIDHDDTGRPLLPDYNLSVSHTRGWAALILSPSRRVAVDIEYMSDRVGRVAHRFIRPDEQSDGLSRQLINWSAKETVYKYYSEENLQYFDMRLHAFEVKAKGSVDVDDLKLPKTLRVNYEVNEEFVLTYSF